MAGKIKKGFTTYLIVLLIAIVAAFLICVTVMMFSPFKSVLGIKYFVYKDEAYVYHATGEESASDKLFNFETIEEINVNCRYADVKVERSTNVDKYALYFENRAQGFAKENQNTDFEYEISYNDDSKTVLNIDIHEPEGFLYFNNNVTVHIWVPIASTYALENTEINVVSTSGDLYLGNPSEITNVGSNELGLNSFSFKTNGGKLKLNSFVEDTFDNIFVKGNKSVVDLTGEIVVNDSFNLYTKAGRVLLGEIDVDSASEVVLNIGNANFKANSIIGDINLFLKDGYFNLAKMDGNVISHDATQQMRSGVITINEIVSGNVSLPFLNGTTVNIKKIPAGSDIFVNSTSGNINIKETYGMVYVETKSGNVNVHTYADDIQIKTVSGDINVAFDSSIIANGIDVETQKGKVDFKIRSQLACVLTVYNSKGELRNKNIEIEWIANEFDIPLTINGGGELIVLTSDAKINISLLDVA